MDAVERNIAVVRRLEDAFNDRRYSDLDQLVANVFEGHNPGSSEVSVEGLVSNNESWHAAMPDKRTEVVSTFGDGDRVVARIQDRGTNTGGLPWFGIPANGRKMDMGWVQITRHGQDGRIIEMWALADVPGLLSQLGAVARPR
ncbi:MAG TPA: ester cyclase [Acidimicrobiia bacterium]|nr:ester cyclase [Acidimicrobiia bacterium]